MKPSFLTDRNFWLAITVAVIVAVLLF